MTEVPMALYFHVGQPERSAPRHYMMDPRSLERFRKAVDDPKRGQELDRMLPRCEKRASRSISHDTFKRVPQGIRTRITGAEH